MKKAFTLAEVLITLGIIGVVAAMTIPTLINNYKGQVTVTKLKKVYSVLSQAVQLAVPDADYGSVPFTDGSNEGMQSWYDAIVKPYIKVTKTCVYKAGCWNDGAKLLNGAEPIYDMRNKGIGGNNITFDTVDGFFITVDVWGGADVTNTLGVTTDDEAVVIYVDLNGKGHPNIVGKDIFVFTYTVERGLLPAGRDFSDEYVKTNCSSVNTGMFCLEHLIRQSWNIKNTNILK